MLAFAVPTFAQAPPTLPPSVEPGRLQQQFQPPAGAPPVSPSISVEQPGPENAPPAGADKIKLTLDGVTVNGATVYTAEDFAPLIAPYLHHEITLVDLFHLADAVTAKYRADGYILSRAMVPAQRIGATATIQAVEGFVSAVHFQGYDSATLDAYGDRIMASKPLRTADLERYLLLADDLAGVQAHAVLAPSPTVPGGAELTIVAEHKLVDGLAAIDNRGTKFIGPIQFYGGAGVNIPGWDDRLAARYITTPTIKELQYGELSYTHPIGSDGLHAIIYGNATRSEPGYTLEPFYIHSDGDELTFTLAYPLLRSRDHNLALSASFDVKDLETIANLNSTLPPSSDDHLRVLRFALTHDLADAWGGINLLTAQFSRGLNILGASANDMRVTPSRPNAQSDFTTWKGEISRQQDLSMIYPGIGFLMSAEGQLSEAGALPASEQFSLGGTQYGRAYDPSDVVADNGWAAKSELRYSPPIPGFVVSWLNSNQFYGFYEWGRVMRNIATVGKPGLADAGFGLRFQVASQLSSDLEVAKPLSRDETINYGQFHARPWRFFLSVTTQF